jgi:hypothetical protein
VNPLAQVGCERKVIAPRTIDLEQHHRPLGVADGVLADFIDRRAPALGRPLPDLRHHLTVNDRVQQILSDEPLLVPRNARKLRESAVKSRREVHAPADSRSNALAIEDPGSAVLESPDCPVGTRMPRMPVNRRTRILHAREPGDNRQAVVERGRPFLAGSGEQTELMAGQTPAAHTCSAKGRYDECSSRRVC